MTSNSPIESRTVPEPGIAPHGNNRESGFQVEGPAWSFWEWPFFDESHRDLAVRIAAWNAGNHVLEGEEPGIQCRRLVSSLGAAGLLHFAIPNSGTELDVRALCLVREGLAFQHTLADSLFAMQCIGTLAIQRFGTSAQRGRYLDDCRAGGSIAAFALTESEAGSDVAAVTTRADRKGDEYVINGSKILVTNAGFADHYLVIARTAEGPGSKGLSAFMVDADTAGLQVGPPVEFMAAHPAASLTFSDCRVPVSNLIGAPGSGFGIAITCFDIIRSSVGAAAVGLARRALHESLQRVAVRTMAGRPMAEAPTIQVMLADMVTDIETSALSVYRAAWEYDVRGTGKSYFSSMAKLCGSEAAGRVADRAVQIFGGAGVTRGNVVERLYREARALRIYEGASEIQRLLIGRQLIKEFATEAKDLLQTAAAK